MERHTNLSTESEMEEILQALVDEGGAIPTVVAVERTEVSATIWGETEDGTLVRVEVILGLPEPPHLRG